MELIDKLGIDWRLLIAQIINFLILLLVLYKLLYRPILNLLDKRQKMIEKSLDDARQIEENLKRSEGDREVKIEEARKAAVKLLEEAAKQAAKNKKETLEETKVEVQKIIAESQEQINKDKEKMFKEIKGEVGELVVKAASQVIGKVISQDIDEKLVKETLKKLES